ncbi:cellular retinoic acid-binding protein 2-like [Saccoglossus kowalevskii]|uniref:Cellular retinoic acid-binding protein 2-like n=1 Tax=Saccoglossus kowalevskii TaxID=10224 RepID=A0ABM0MPU8_SACKO|nr:PREDICTED: cellular retinoic acid-binding protein 2-like [Saccoglossus kowalevskii]
MKPNFAGLWQAETSENLERIYKNMGIIGDALEIAINESPKIEIRQSGEYFYIKTESKVVGKVEVSFKVGEIYEVPDHRWRNMKHKTSWVGGGKKLQIRPLNGSGSDPIHVYEMIGDDKLVMYLHALGETAKQTFVKQTDKDK